MAGTHRLRRHIFRLQMYTQKPYHASPGQESFPPFRAPMVDNFSGASRKRLTFNAPRKIQTFRGVVKHIFWFFQRMTEDDRGQQRMTEDGRGQQRMAEDEKEDVAPVLFRPLQSSQSSSGPLQVLSYSPLILFSSASSSFILSACHLMVASISRIWRSCSAR